MIHPPIKPSWVSVESEALRVLAVDNLIKNNPQLLSTEQREMLERIATGKNKGTELPIYIDVSKLTWLVSGESMREYRSEALLYLLKRGSPHGLLHRLFNVSKRQVTELRKQHAVPPLFADSARLADGRLHDIYRKWDEITDSEEFDNEIDRWIAFADHFQDISVATLQTAITIDVN